MERILVWGWKYAKVIRRITTWLLATLIFLGISGFVIWDKSNIGKTALLPGQTTNGHYQFEQACELCHSAFDGVPNKSCLNCHEAELKISDDSHRAKVFRDPRNAADLEKINAMECTTCHNEHAPDSVTELGVTLANDFCIHCHEDVAEERTSHKGMAFNNCRLCHNYHDNRSLHEDHIAKHTDEPDTFKHATVPPRFVSTITNPPLHADALDWPQGTNDTITRDWASTRHAQASINCSQCHQDANTKQFSEATTFASCKRCHAKQADGFQTGKHGIRQQQGLSPMSPAEARLPMQADAMHKQLGCTSCHSDHVFDTRVAAVEPCMQCHADQHTQAYKQSPHYQLYLKELSGDLPKNSGVSCATCHMPRLRDHNSHEERYYVQHNQSDNLRPNSKMVRDVCQHCHGLRFTLDSLADAQLINNNFQGRSNIALKSIPMVISRIHKNTPQQ